MKQTNIHETKTNIKCEPGEWALLYGSVHTHSHKHYGPGNIRKPQKSFTICKSFFTHDKSNNNDNNSNNKHNQRYRCKYKSNNKLCKPKTQWKTEEDTKGKNRIYFKETNERKRKNRNFCLCVVCTEIYLSILVLGIMWPPNRQDNECVSHALFIYLFLSLYFRMLFHTLSVAWMTYKTLNIYRTNTS